MQIFSLLLVCVSVWYFTATLPTLFKCYIFVIAAVVVCDINICQTPHLTSVACLFTYIQDVFKKRPNFCYEDFIAHFTSFYAMSP